MAHRRLGCHNDRRNGGYHCHRGPLKGGAYNSKTEAQHDIVHAGEAPGGDDRVGETRPVEKEATEIAIAGASTWFVRSERSRFGGSQTMFAALFAEDTVIDSIGPAYQPIIAVGVDRSEDQYRIGQGQAEMA